MSARHDSPQQPHPLPSDTTPAESDRFSAYVEARNRWMIRKAFYYGKGRIRRADAEDIAQTVLIATWRAGTWATLDERALDGYIATAIKHATSNYLRDNRRLDRAIATYAVHVNPRRGSRVLPKPDSDSAGDAPFHTHRRLRHPEAKALEDTLLNEMRTRAALDRLPAQRREIVLAILWEGKTQAVIAKELGLPPWKVSRELAAALAALREDLGDGA